MVYNQITDNCVECGEYRPLDKDNKIPCGLQANFVGGV